jgi:F0F1-type ATP synthase epsilon subunit
MQPYNNYFPANYQPYQTFNPYQNNAYQQNYQNYQQSAQMQQPVQQMQQVQPQQMQNQAYTLPTIHAEIVQVDDEQAAKNFNVAVGTSQMMIAKDDSAIFVKTAYANGESKLDVYEKRLSQTDTAVQNFDNYVTTEMLEKRLQELVNGLNRQPYSQKKQNNPNKEMKENKVKENEQSV